MSYIPEEVTIQNQLTDVRINEWLSEEFLKPKWWALILIVLILFVVWFKMIDKSRIREICLFTVLLTIIFMGIDEYGEELVLWDYPIDIIPLFPPLSSINLISIPLIYSQIYQHFKQKKFIYAVLISSAVICFVAEPLLTFLGYYDLINWHYYESYPIYVVVTLCTKGIVQKIMYISNKSSCIRNAG